MAKKTHFSPTRAQRRPRRALNMPFVDIRHRDRSIRRGGMHTNTPPIQCTHSLSTSTHTLTRSHSLIISPTPSYTVSAECRPILDCILKKLTALCESPRSTKPTRLRDGVRPTRCAQCQGVWSAGPPPVYCPHRKVYDLIAVLKAEGEAADAPNVAANAQNGADEEEEDEEE